MKLNRVHLWIEHVNDMSNRHFMFGLSSASVLDEWNEIALQKTN